MQRLQERSRSYGFLWIRPYCCQTNSIIQNDVAHVICTFIGLNIVCPGLKKFETGLSKAGSRYDVPKPSAEMWVC